ncbi:MAG: hypothetical protein AAF805_09950 [Planctomycetota bacterium]
MQAIYPLARFCALVVTCAASAATHAAPTVDGSLAGDAAFYGPALSVQNTNTQFGDATNGDPYIAQGGSEIDQVFAATVGDRLHVLVTGNFENNYNKLNVFLDTEAGGMNTINAANAPANVDPFCCEGPGAVERHNGLTFDAGFAADHYLIFSNGPERVVATNVTFDSFSAYYAELNAGPGGRKNEVGYHAAPLGVEPGLAQGEPIDRVNNNCVGDSDTGCAPAWHLFAEQRDFENEVGLRMAIDNRNTGGVRAGGGAQTGDPQNVTTGIEFSLPLSSLGFPTGDLKIAAFIGNSRHDFVSNQFAGDGVLQGNLGFTGFGGQPVDLAAIAGQQFVTVPHAALAGDYRYDGAVDAADYTVWRDQQALGFADAAGYGVWAGAFGSGSAGVVPEPTALAAVASALLATVASTGRASPPSAKPTRALSPPGREP